MYETLLGLICPISRTPSQGFFLALSMKETSLDPTVLIFQSLNSVVLQEASRHVDVTTITGIFSSGQLPITKNLPVTLSLIGWKHSTKNCKNLPVTWIIHLA
jgi:hypothetical protein